MNNRGLSPLVATLILILISAALGGLVMAYGESYIEERAEFVGKAYDEPSCSDVSISFIQINNDDHICIDPEVRRIRMFVEAGVADVNTVALRLIGSDDLFSKDNVLSSQIAAYDSAKVEASYTDIGDLKQIKLIPYSGGQACAPIEANAPFQLC